MILQSLHVPPVLSRPSRRARGGRLSHLKYTIWANGVIRVRRRPQGRLGQPSRARQVYRRHGMNYWNEHASHDARRQPDAVLHRLLRAPSPPAPDTFLRSFHQQIAAHCLQRTRAMVRRWRRRCWSCSLAAAQAEHQGEARRRGQGRHGVPGGLPGTTDPLDAADVGKLRARRES